MSPALSRTEEAERRAHAQPFRLPPEAQRRKIESISEALRELPVRGRPSPGSFKLVAPSGRELEVPPALLELLAEISEVLAEGNTVTVIPVGKLLTTQQAANILNVSRQYLVRLLEGGEIRFTKTGKHRRLRIQDVLAYRKKRDAARRESLDELTRLTQEAGGYPELG